MVCFGLFGKGILDFSSLVFGYPCLITFVKRTGIKKNKFRVQGPRPKSSLGVKRVPVFAFKGLMREPTLEKGNIGGDPWS